MRRPLRSLVLVVLVGAVVNVVVAWAFAMRRDLPRTEEGGLSHADDPTWVIRKHVSVGTTIVRSTPAVDAVAPAPLRPDARRSEIDGHVRRLKRMSLLPIGVPYWSGAHTRPDQPLALDAPQESVATIVEDARGWPFRALRSSARGAPGENPPRRCAIPTNLTDNALGEPIVLPLQPIWPGFVANTLIYGLTALLAIELLRQLRQASRARAGRCLRCGYLLRNTLPCSECGWAPRSWDTADGNAR